MFLQKLGREDGHLAHAQIQHFDDPELVIAADPHDVSGDSIGVASAALQCRIRRDEIGLWLAFESFDEFELLVEEESIVGLVFEDEEVAAWSGDYVVQGAFLRYKRVY